MALLLIIGKLITSIIFLFAKGEIYPIYINTLNTVLFGFCVFVILVTELNRDGINLINHTFFDLFSLLISYIIIYIAFKILSLISEAAAFVNVTTSKLSISIFPKPYEKSVQMEKSENS